MKKTVAFIVVAGALVASGSTAEAKEYGDSGTIELGGELTFFSESRKAEDEDNNFKTDNSGTNMQLEPEIAYYLLNGLPLFVGLELGMESDTDNESSPKETDTAQTFGLSVGTGYLLKLGKARIGPAVALGFSQTTLKSKAGSDESEATRSGPEVTIAGLAKLPVGSGGVITAGLFVENKMQKEKVKDVDGEADVTTMSFGTSVGFAVWF